MIIVFDDDEINMDNFFKETFDNFEKLLKEKLNNKFGENNIINNTIYQRKTLTYPYYSDRIDIFKRNKTILTYGIEIEMEGGSIYIRTSNMKETGYERKLINKFKITLISDNETQSIIDFIINLIIEENICE